MGLFDKLKTTVTNAVEGFNADFEEAAVLEVHALCDALKEMKLLDKKKLGYVQALNNKCEVMSDDELEDIYMYIKKTSSFLVEHPGRDTVEDELVKRNMYCRNDDGTITKNSAHKWFK